MSTINTGHPEKQKQRAIIILAMAAALLGASLYVDRDALTTQLEIIIGIFTFGSLAIAWRDIVGRPGANAEGKSKHIRAVRKVFEFSLELLAVGFVWIIALLGTASLQTAWPVEVAFLLTSLYGAFCWRRHRARRSAIPAAV